MNKFINKLEKRWKKQKFVCVGLDSDYSKIPKFLKDKNKNSKLPVEAALYEFNKSIIKETADLVCAYKINSAFYEADPQTWEAMGKTFYYIKRTYPEIPVILDAKRGDIGNTNEGYVKMAFETLKADAMTVHPYLGEDSLQPFLDMKDKGIIVLVKTSNLGSGEFQDLKISGQPLYKLVARRVAKAWNKFGNCGVVVGATYPEELKEIRKIIGDMPILIPGIGAQGGDLENTIKYGKGKKSWGMIINSSRGIIFASNGKDFAKAAREKTLALHQQIVNVI